MLVFALLMDRTGLTANNSGIVVINKPEHQLPLFVVTFGTAHAVYPGMAPGMPGINTMVGGLGARLAALAAHFAARGLAPPALPPTGQSGFSLPPPAAFGVAQRRSFRAKTKSKKRRGKR
jgi:hypothetical protein